MAYLVHHTLNRNGIYPGGKPNPVPFDEKSCTDNRSAKKTTKKSILFSFKTNGRKCDFECPIHRTINSGKIEGTYFDRIRSIIFMKKFT